MMRKFGLMLFVSASCTLMTLGCQKQSDGVAEQKTLTKAEAAKYRLVSIDVTGLT